MANNRIFLRCRKCGSILFLGKCYGDGYFYQNYRGSDLETELNDFYEKHAYCSEPLNESDIDFIGSKFVQEDSYYNRFEIAYEFEDEEDDEVKENET